MTVFVGLFISDAFAVAFPARGFHTEVPLVFSNSTDIQNPLVALFVSFNTTQEAGLAFVAQAPIYVSARIVTFPNAWNSGAYQVGLTFQDAQPFQNGRELVQIPTSAVIQFTKNRDGIWWGNGTIWFPFEVNSVPTFSVGYLGHTITLPEVGNQFVLPIQPVSTVGTTFSSLTNIVLAGSAFFFALIGSVVVLREIYPETVERTYEETDD